MRPAWLFWMAWRDSRRSRSRLLLYTCSIVLGVAALVAVSSLSRSLADAVESQSRSLLGADVSFSRNQPFNEEVEEFFSTFGNEYSNQISFTSMAFFPGSEATRLVRVRAVEEGYPYYGALETDPEGAATRLREGEFAVVEEGLLLQVGAQPGDTIRIGDLTLQVAGKLLRAPGESLSFSNIGARVYIPFELAEATGLIQTGSRVRYTRFFKLPPAVDVEQLLEETEEERHRLGLSVESVQERREEFGNALENLSSFLSLIGFVALILGGLGVASAIHVYVKARLRTVAILRCVGATPVQCLAVYSIQAVAIGLVGSIVGIGSGYITQNLLHRLVSTVLPVQVDPVLHWISVVEGLFLGLSFSLLFTLIPLLKIRDVSPLLALRADFEPEAKRSRDPLVIIIYSLIACIVFGFSVLEAGQWTSGAGFFLGVVVAFGLLILVSRILMAVSRLIFKQGARYELRQGLANLYRPQNQTTLLMLAVGLGTFVVLSLYLVQHGILQEIHSTAREGRPNLIFFDIQEDQKTDIRKLVEAHGLEAQDSVPIVSMRLAAINGTSVEEIVEDPSNQRSRWAMRREYRSTYRDHLADTEKLIHGSFSGTATGEVVDVSIEERIARELQVEQGDSLTFDVQGIEIETRVGSIREVDWRNFAPNFFVVFPSGVLEQAPQFHVLLARAFSTEESAGVQREVVQRFPNVSAIDLALLIQTIDSILDQATTVIRFMFLFTVVTAFIVLLGALLSGRHQRVRESVLLRTLGASKRQVGTILLVEYLLAGAFSVASGLLLAIPASWILLTYVFNVSFSFNLSAVFFVLVAVVLLTVTLGLTSSRGVLKHPPLQILRIEE